ncbi:MAG: hypothetical protein K5668_10675 [Lachnospiraceae bacterium]|nr:hypothetical protein [Lachnospiraceae bacterium]
MYVFDALDIINLITVVSGLTIVLMGLIFSVAFPNLQKTDRMFFIAFFSLLTAYISSDLLSQISLVYLVPGYLMLSKAAVFMESLLSSLCMPLLTCYILTLSGRKRKPDPCILFFSLPRFF